MTPQEHMNKLRAALVEVEQQTAVLLNQGYRVKIEKKGDPSMLAFFPQGNPCMKASAIKSEVHRL